MMRTWTIVLLIVPLLVLPWAGCGGGGGNGDPTPPNPQPDDPTPPEVTAASVEPAQVRFSGGDVAISATVVSEEAVDRVEATVQGPGVAQTVALQAGGGGYAGIFIAPGNLSGEGVTYQVTVTATDAVGLSSEPFSVGQFSVLTASDLPVPEGPPGGW